MIPAGAIGGTITVQVHGDIDVEPNETFFVDITSGDAIIDDGHAVGTITNDDALLKPNLTDVEDQVVLVGATKLVTLSADDPDGEETALVFDIVNEPAFATLQNHGNGTATLTLAPVAGQAGAYTNVVIQVTDQDNQTADDTITIFVNNRPNRPPYAVSDRGWTHGTGPVSIDVLLNDSDIDGDSLTVVGVEDDRGGRVVCSPNECTYTPTDGQVIPDTFVYRVSDGHGNISDAEVTVRILENGVPTALVDHGEVHGTAGVGIDILTNDSDPEHDFLTVTVIREPTKGSVSCGDSCFYVPDAEMTDTDSFEYRIDDGHGAFDTAEVTIDLVPNLPPDPVDDDLLVHGTGPESIDVTRNDVEPEGDSLGATFVGPLNPAIGSASCAGASCTYTPPAPLPAGAVFPIKTSFLIRVDDGHGGSATSTVHVSIVPNHDPKPKDDWMSAPQQAPGFAKTGVVVPLPNDSDPDGDRLDVGDWTQGDHGTVSCEPPVGTLPWRCYYIAEGNATEPDTFTYSVYDHHGSDEGPLAGPEAATDGWATATVHVTLRPNHGPIANPDTIVTHGPRGQELALLVNDRDLDDDDLEVVAVPIEPLHGDVSCASDCVYTPDAGYVGGDGFDYRIGDGRGGFATAHVTIVVVENRGPIAKDDRATARFGEAIEIDVLANDSEPEGDPLTLELVSGTENGRAICGSTGCSYQAPRGFFGTETFRYRITDPGDLTAEATVTVTTIENQAPIAHDQEVDVSTLTTRFLNPVLGDSDPDDDPIRLYDWTEPEFGTFACPQQCFYTPPTAGAPLDDSFTYTITDDRGGFDTATVTIYVVANTPPRADDDSGSTLDTRTLWLEVVGNDDDADGDEIRVLSHGSAEHGSVNCVNVPDLPIPPPQRTYCSYTLHRTYTGPFPIDDQFTYVATDGKTAGTIDGTTEDIEATVHVHVDINRGPVAEDDTAITHDRVPVTINVLGTDSDLDGDPLRIIEFTGPNLSCTATSCVYTPPAPPPTGYPFQQLDPMTYTISDGQEGSNSICDAAIRSSLPSFSLPCATRMPPTPMRASAKSGSSSSARR